MILKALVPARKEKKANVRDWICKPILRITEQVV